MLWQCQAGHDSLAAMVVVGRSLEPGWDLKFEPGDWAIVLEEMGGNLTWGISPLTVVTLFLGLWDP